MADRKFQQISSSLARALAGNATSASGELEPEASTNGNPRTLTPIGIQRYDNRAF